MIADGILGLAIDVNLIALGRGRILFSVCASLAGMVGRGAAASATLSFTATIWRQSDLISKVSAASFVASTYLPMASTSTKISVLVFVNSFPSMEPYMAPISNLYFAGENHCVLTFARLFYKCNDEYIIY